MVANIIIALAVGLALTGIIVRAIRARKNGGASCGCCSACSSPEEKKPAKAN